MELVKMTMVQMRGMLDQIAVPHSLDLRGHNVEEFARATDQGANVSALRLARSAAGLFVPDTTRSRKIETFAPNGWETDRIAFAMVVAVNNRERSKTYKYIVGTTDLDMSSGSDTRVKFDRRMKLYFNSITTIHMNESVHRGNRVWVPKIKSHDQILSRASLTGFDQEGRMGFKERPVSLRPTDLFRRQTGQTHFAKHFEREGAVTNMCGAFTAPLKASNRVNNSTSNYLSRTLSAYMASAADPELAHHYDENKSDTLNHAHDRVEENDLELDPWMEEMKQSYRILDDGFITWGQLEKMNPDFDFDRIIFGKYGNRSRGNSLANQSGWKGTDNETVAARIIAQSLPGIMINSMYSEVEGLVLKSNVRMGEDSVHIAQAWPYVDGISTRAQWPYFEGSCRDVLLHEATCGGRFEIDAHIDANIDGLIKIKIRVDGGPESYHEWPCCMDASLAPTLETDSKAFDRLAKGIVGLASELSARRMDDNPGHSDTPSLSTSASRVRNDRDERRDDDRRDRRPQRTERDW